MQVIRLLEQKMNSKLSGKLSILVKRLCDQYRTRKCLNLVKSGKTLNFKLVKDNLTTFIGISSIDK